MNDFDPQKWSKENAVEWARIREEGGKAIRAAMSQCGLNTTNVGDGEMYDVASLLMASPWFLQRTLRSQRAADLEARLRADIEIMTIYGTDFDRAEKALDNVQAEARKDALEEAARYVETTTLPMFDSGTAAGTRLAAGIRALGGIVIEAAEDVQFATQYDVESHGAKQAVSYADAWRYFERNGYDMSKVEPQYGGANDGDNGDGLG